MKDEREFPILIGSGYGTSDYTIPWGLLAPHEAQALKNHGQTLERLAQRHGLSFCEALAIIEDRPWKPVKNAWIKVGKYVTKYWENLIV